MANDITGNPWLVDTPGVIYEQRFKFDDGIWGNAAAGSRLTFLDGTGRTVLDVVYPTDLSTVSLPKLGWINGLICTAINGSCTLYVASR